MTREEEIQNKAKEVCEDPRFEESFSPIEAYIAGAVYADKHPINQWHDLRKNPDDLPQKYDVYIVHTEGNTKWFCLFDINGWHTEVEHIAKVVAWTPIPKFEEE